MVLTGTVLFASNRPNATFSASDLIDGSNISRALFINALENITNVLKKMNWGILLSKHDQYFILSDNPVALLDPDLFQKQ